MISFKLINEVLGLPSVIAESPDYFSQFSMDTRTIQKDQLFFAIQGEQRDGHDYLPGVANKAMGAVVERINPDLALTQWRVNDVTKAMGQLAKALRQKYAHIPLVGITGSCGKTTTTRLLAHICKQAIPTLSSQKSLNNQWGVPLTLSRISENDKVIIQEMGTNLPEEIDYISKIAQPTIALITLIAPVHLEGLGSLDGIANEKADIYRNMASNGTAIINADDAYRSYFEDLLLPTQQAILFSLKDNNVAVSLASEPSYTEFYSEFVIKINDKTFPIKLPLLGIHNIANALAATACALALNIDAQIIVDALYTAKAPEQRLVRFYSQQGYTVLDDSYNANPLAMKMAFQILSREGGRQIAILGDMAECGDQAEDVHRQLAHDLNESGIDAVYTTGFWMRALHDEAFHLNLQSEYFKKKQDLIDFLRQALTAGDCVLVKGSLSSGMKEVVDAIK